jgi:ABC-type multidrug transport system fused ATPase/permease subunit
VEQFQCHADSCTQNLGNGGASANWICQNLQCTCRPNTSFCGGVATFDLTQIVNQLSGTLEIDCGVVGSSTHTSTCNFKQGTIQNVFGSSGLVLNGCTFGECVRQSVIDNGGNVTASSQNTSGGKPLSGGVIAGLAVVGSLVFLALMLLLFGYVQQRAARKAHFGEIGGIKVNVEWNGVSYAIPTDADIFGLWPKRDLGNFSNAKVVVDSVSGTVKAGEMMAILGPSGTYVSHRCGRH